MISDEEKRIYNNYLVASRKSQDLPFKIRKNFDKFDTDKIPILQRLKKFFDSYDHVDQEDFFMAPYKVWPDTTKFDLEFFVTPKARKAYAQYVNKRELEDPDTEDSLKRLIEGLKFVYQFCVEKSLTFEDYPLYVEKSLPSVIAHLKDHKINFYVLHALGISRLNIETRVLNFVIEDFYKTLQITKNKFYTSKKMRKLANRALTKLTEKLNN